MMKKKKSPWQATDAAVENSIHIRVDINVWYYVTVLKILVISEVFVII